MQPIQRQSRFYIDSTQHECQQQHHGWPQKRTGWVWLSNVPLSRVVCGRGWVGTYPVTAASLSLRMHQTALFLFRSHPPHSHWFQPQIHVPPCLWVTVANCNVITRWILYTRWWTGRMWPRNWIITITIDRLLRLVTYRPIDSMVISCIEPLRLSVIDTLIWAEKKIELTVWTWYKCCNSDDWGTAWCTAGLLGTGFLYVRWNISRLLFWSSTMSTTKWQGQAKNKWKWLHQRAMQ